MTTSERIQLAPAVEHLWQYTFAGILSTLGRLLHVAGFKDAITGRYSLPAPGYMVGVHECDELLRVLHAMIWADWINASFSEQQADFRLFLTGSRSANVLPQPLSASA